MTAPLRIRPERADDVEAIAAVNRAAFGQANEADLVDALRADATAWLPHLSLVAERDGRIIGHLLVSRLRLDGPDGGIAAGLAPMAVASDVQRTGVGAALIRHAVDEARATGERLIVVLGHAGYYPRFGFAAARPQGVLPPFDVDDAHWMALDLTGTGDHPRGTVIYPPAFQTV